MNQSIMTAISSVNGNQLFECECGERYEVEITGATIGNLETSVVEDREKDGLESKDDGTNRQPIKSFLCPNATCRRSYCSQVISPPAVPFLFLTSSLALSQCFAKSHPTKTCHEASIERTLELIRAVSIEDVDPSSPSASSGPTTTTTFAYLGGMALSLLLGFKSSSVNPLSSALSPSTSKRTNGINIQHCPNCDAAYSVPINCYHAVCESQIGGCGTEFCFICSAIRSPILAHGNMMHRASCPYNLDQFCCRSNCLKSHQRTCREMKWNENCSECLKNKEGEVCSFPLESNPPDSGKHWKILDLSDVQREAEMIQAMR
jgi:hypothetical protein